MPHSPADRARILAEWNRAQVRAPRAFPVWQPPSAAPTCPECGAPLSHYGGWSYGCRACTRGYVVPPVEDGTAALVGRQ